MADVGPELLAGRGIILVDVVGVEPDPDELYVRIGRVPVRVYAAGNFTLDAALDEGAYVVVTAAANVQVPPDLPSGWACAVRRQTAGVVTITAGSGVTLLSAESLVAVVENRAVSITANGTNTAYLDGALE